MPVTSVERLIMTSAFVNDKPSKLQLSVTCNIFSIHCLRWL